MSTRQIGFNSLGSIPWTAVDTYAKRFGIEDPEEFQLFKEIVLKIDREYIKWHNEQRDKKD